MSKSLCFIHTINSGLHTTNDFCSKKNLYCFSRLVSLKYEIGILVDNKYSVTKTIDNIIIPRCFIIPEKINNVYNINQNVAINTGIEIEIILNMFIKDIINVDIIICHDSNHHLNTIISESIRYNIGINLSNYLIIDTINFHNNYNISIEEIFNKLILNDNSTNILYMLRIVFFKLYSIYKKSIKV